MEASSKLVHQTPEYSGDELAAMFGLSRSLAYRRRREAVAARVDLMRTDDALIDKKRMQHAFGARYRRPQVQHYVCKECGEPNTMGSGRKRTACHKCVPNARARNRYFKFQMTEPAYQALFENQGGKCGICKRKLTHQKTKGSQTYACIDHCHQTGRVRGLLCPSCNIKLSGVENPVWYEEALRWLATPE